MDTSDLRASIRVAQSACRTARKEASFAEHALSENESEKAYAGLVEDSIHTALSYLEAAADECDKIDKEDNDA